MALRWLQACSFTLMRLIRAPRLVSTMVRELSWRQQDYHLCVYSTAIPKPEIYNTDHDDTQSVKLSDSVAD